MEALSAEVEEPEAAMALVDVNDMSEEEIQTFAVEAQEVVDHPSPQRCVCAPISTT